MKTFVELVEEIKKGFDKEDNSVLSNLEDNIEYTSTATVPHAVGTYLVYNKAIYRVTAPIATGNTLTPGTNITVASDIMSLIAAQGSDLSDVEECIAPVESTTSASRAYAIGEKFIKNHALYQAKTAIALGDALVLDTNYELADDITTQLSSLNQTLTNKTDGIVANINANGSKNICPLKVVNQTIRGITITDSDDGTYKILNGTSTGNPLMLSLLEPTTPYPVDFTNWSNVVRLTPVQLGIDVTKKYIFARNSYDNVRMSLYIFSGTTMVHEFELGTNASINNIEIDFTGYTFDTIGIFAKIGNNVSLTNYALKPILMLKSDWELDPSYQPYAKTNRQLTEDSVDWDNFSKLGAVNVLQNTATTQTVGNEVTFTVNSDKTIAATFSAKPTANRQIQVCGEFTLNKPMTLSGCPSGGGTGGGYRLIAQETNNIYYVDLGEGTTLPSGSYRYVTAIVGSDTPASASPLVFKPMLAPVDYNGDYVPYAKTNRELTEDLKNKIVSQQVGLVVSTANTATTQDITPPTEVSDYMSKGGTVSVFVIPTGSQTLAGDFIWYTRAISTAKVIIGFKASVAETYNCEIMYLLR